MRRGSAQESVKLTERQKEVLRLLYDGNGKKAIAQRLNITPRSVEDHVNNIAERFSDIDTRLKKDKSEQIQELGYIGRIALILKIYREHFVEKKGESRTVLIEIEVAEGGAVLKRLV